MRRSKRARGIVWVFLLVAILVYAVGPQAGDAIGPVADLHQDGCIPKGPAVDPDAVPRPNPGVVKKIHLTNNGEFVNRCEFTDALYELTWDVKRRSGPPVREGARNLPRLTLLYVHGWKHNADDDDSDLKAFTALVQNLAQKHRDQKQVVGIYVGWNASTGLGVLDNLTFWSKKNIADRISQSAVLTKIISSIGATRRTDSGRMDQFIAIGHSFGARMVFTGTSQTLVTEASRAHPGAPDGEYAVIASSADAVVLLNPAFEASLYTTLNSFCRAQERFPADQAPVLVSIATDGDEATRFFFPIGQWIGMYRGAMDRTTLGNFEQYRTHTLTRADQASCLADASGELTERYFFNGLCLKRMPKTEAPKCTHNPFIVAGTSSDIIKNHSEIWNPQFLEWMSVLIAQLEASHKRLLQRTVAN